MIYVNVNSSHSIKNLQIRNRPGGGSCQSTGFDMFLAILQTTSSSSQTTPVQSENTVHKPSHKTECYLIIFLYLRAKGKILLHSGVMVQTLFGHSLWTVFTFCTINEFHRVQNQLHYLQEQCFERYLKTANLNQKKLIQLHIYILNQHNLPIGTRLQDTSIRALVSMPMLPAMTLAEGVTSV